MPIRGLTDTGASFPRIGELRKGAPKPEKGNRPGLDLDHFRFTSNDDSALQSFRSAYGDEPDRINVFLPFNTADENFEAWCEEWGAGSLKWRGDGETLVLWQRPDGTYSTEPKPQPNGGKETGRLKVIIPELKRLAYVVVLTTSKWDISELHSNLSAYEAMRGSLQGIPFILSRVPRMISTPTPDGKRVRREKYLLHIEAAPQWVQSQLSVMKRMALPDAGDIPMLESGEMVDVETGEILDKEPAQDELPTAEFEEIRGATDTGNVNEPTDSRGASSPQAQAKRKRPSPPKAKKNGNGINWKAKAKGQKFEPFASCLVNAGVGYESEQNVESALGNMGEQYDENDTDRLWKMLVERKQTEAA